MGIVYEKKIQLAEDDAYDIVVNGEMTVHVFKSDCGYVVDIIANKKTEDDILNTVAVWDEDLAAI